MLKKITVIMIAGLLISVFLLAQDTGKIIVPLKVKNKMLALYPQTQDVPVTWSKEGLNYKGSLTIMEKPANIVFDSTGKVIYVEKRIHPTYLPKKISAQLNSNYPGNIIQEVFEYTNAAGKKTYKTTYQVIITTQFNEDGTVSKSK